jgi:hypothetical protein
MTPTEPNKLVSVGFFMLIYLWLGLGGARGTIVRFRLNAVVSRRFEISIPLPGAEQL